MATIRLTGYCDPLSVRPGDTLRCMISADGTEQADMHVVRLMHGDEHPEGPGFVEREVAVVRTDVEPALALHADAVASELEIRKCGLDEGDHAVEVSDDEIGVFDAKCHGGSPCWTSPTSSGLVGTPTELLVYRPIAISIAGRMAGQPAEGEP